MMGSFSQFGPAVAYKESDFGSPVPLKTATHGSPTGSSHPGFLAGLRESAGLPGLSQGKQTAAEFYKSLYHHPLTTVRETGSEALHVLDFVSNNPGKFLEAMSNYPQIRDAWDKGNYRELAGLLAGTIPQFAAIGAEAAKVPLGVRAGLAGKSVEEIAAAEKAAKAAKSSETLRVTLGERLAGKFPSIEKVETVMRGMPGASGPFRRLAEQRSRLVLSYRDALTAASDTLQNRAQSIYNNLDRKIPGFDALQQERHNYWREYRRLAARDEGQAAFTAREKALEREAELKRLVEVKGDASDVHAWQAADRLWSEKKAKDELVDIIRKHTKGFEPDPSARVPFGKRQLTPMTEDIKKLDDSGILKRAIPDSSKRRDLMTLSDLYDRINRKGRGYILERLLGYGILGGGALGYLSGSYIGEMAGGAAISLLLADSVSIRAGGTIRLKGFLQAVDENRIADAEKIAASLGASIAKQAEKQAAAPKKEYPPLKLPAWMQENRASVKESVAEPQAASTPAEPVKTFTLPEAIRAKTTQASAARKMLSLLREGRGSEINPADWKKAMDLTGVNVLSDPNKLADFLAALRKMASMR